MARPWQQSLTTGIAALTLFAAAASTQAEDFDYRIPLEQKASGNLYVTGVVNADVRAEFLLDTGSGLVTVGRKVFAEIRRSGPVEKAGKVAARMADGRLRAVELYRVAHFRIGEQCDIGPLDVAVMPGDDRNILGMNALTRAAPFAVHVAPPQLAISACTLAPELAAAP